MAEFIFSDIQDRIVIPAKAGIQTHAIPETPNLDSRFRGNDNNNA